MLFEVLLIILCAVLLYLLIYIRNQNKQISNLQNFTDDLISGETKKRYIYEKNDAIGLLAASLNKLAFRHGEEIFNAKEQRTRLKETLKSLPDGVVLMDEVGYIRLVNQSFENLFSQWESEVVNKRLVDVLAINDLTEMINNCVENKERQIINIYLEENFKHLEVKVGALRHEGGQYFGMVVIFRDVTREKQVYETRRDFVANVSHELRTPMTVIKASTETLIDGAINDEKVARKFLKTISSHTGRMENLINDLITLSKIELGALPLELDHVSPLEIIDEVFEDYRNDAKKKGLYLQKETDNELLHIEADRNRLLQILTNLVSNSIKYTKEGGVKVSIVDKDGKQFIIVSDTGIGMPKESLSRLGERFYRVDDSRSREIGGTGLGLAIVKHLVKSHNWQMEIDSEEGKGTMVTISL